MHLKIVSHVLEHLIDLFDDDAVGHILPVAKFDCTVNAMGILDFALISRSFGIASARSCIWDGSNDAVAASFFGDGFSSPKPPSSPFGWSAATLIRTDLAAGNSHGQSAEPPDAHSYSHHRNRALVAVAERCALPCGVASVGLADPLQGSRE